MKEPFETLREFWENKKELIKASISENFGQLPIAWSNTQKLIKDNFTEAEASIRKRLNQLVATWSNTQQLIEKNFTKASIHKRFNQLVAAWPKTQKLIEDNFTKVVMVGSVWLGRNIIELRTFIEFVGMTVSGWSVGFIIAQWGLPFLLAGFFGLPVVASLGAVCAVAGVIALITGIIFAYVEYWDLTEKESELLGTYQLFQNLDDKLVEDINLGDVILVKDVNGKENQFIAQFKPFKSIGTPPSTNLILMPQEIAALEAAREQEQHDGRVKIIRNPQNAQMLNKIIKQVISSQGSIFKDTLVGEEKPSKEHQQIITWEKINAFLCDTSNMFALSGIVIYLIAHIFFGPLISATLLIAAIVSIAYGIFSAVVKDAQIDTRLQEMRRLENKHLHWKTQLEGLTSIKTRELAELITSKDLSEEDRASEVVLLQRVTELKEKADTHLQGFKEQLDEIDKKTKHFESTGKDKFYVGLAFFTGGFAAGSFVYVALPLILAVSGVVLSSGALLGIVIAVGVIYGILHLINTQQSIEQEKWNTVNDEELKKISNAFTEITEFEKTLLEEGEIIEAVLVKKEENKKIIEIKFESQDTPVNIMPNSTSPMPKRFSSPIKWGTEVKNEEIELPNVLDTTEDDTLTIESFTPSTSEWFFHVVQEKLDNFSQIFSKGEDPSELYSQPQPSTSENKIEI